MTTTYMVIGGLILLYVLYKFKFENRYSWKQYNDDAEDPKGKLCSSLIYVDKHKEGLQVEYFYEIHLTYDLANAHIKSKNKAYRRSLISRYIERK